MNAWTSRRSYFTQRRPILTERIRPVQVRLRRIFSDTASRWAVSLIDITIGSDDWGLPFIGVPHKLSFFAALMVLQPVRSELFGRLQHQSEETAQYAMKGCLQTVQADEDTFEAALF